MHPAIEYQMAPNPALPAQPDWQQLAADYPWYPVAHWQLALAGNSAAAGRLFSFVQQPLRCQALLTATAAEEVATPLTFEPAEDSQPVTEHQPTTNLTEPPTAADVETETAPAPLNVEEPQPAMPPVPVVSSADDVPADGGGNADVASNSAGAESSDDDSFLFQPYHTVDYFASLGIKIDPNLLTNSQFDRQLKSFTQWLKGMKRMNYQTGQFSDDPLVTRQATESLHKDPVITAAMAEVLARQGLKAEAIALYRKLTLLHPEKSAFFASQIEKLTQ